jgi:hypothetical protein
MQRAKNIQDIVEGEESGKHMLTDVNKVIVIMKLCYLHSIDKNQWI